MTNLSKPGPDLNAAIAVEVMRWHVGLNGGYEWWFGADNRPVAEVGDWRPSTDPTTFFDDVVPRMRELRMRFEFEQSNEKPEEWLCLVCRIAKAHILLGEASHENHATAGCLAALAAARAEAAKEE